MGWSNSPCYLAAHWPGTCQVDLPVSAPQHWNYKCVSTTPGFLCVCWGSNTGCDACKKGRHFTEWVISPALKLYEAFPRGIFPMNLKIEGLTLSWLIYSGLFIISVSEFFLYVYIKRERLKYILKTNYRNVRLEHGWWMWWFLSDDTWTV